MHNAILLVLKFDSLISRKRGEETYKKNLTRFSIFLQVPLLSNIYYLLELFHFGEYTLIIGVQFF